MPTLWENGHVKSFPGHLTWTRHRVEIEGRNDVSLEF